jgi:hypothetical protein
VWPPIEPASVRIMSSVAGTRTEPSRGSVQFYGLAVRHVSSSRLLPHGAVDGISEPPYNMTIGPKTASNDVRTPRRKNPERASAA